MEFKKYQHIERFGTIKTEGIEFGDCYVFPKIDGTSATAFYNNGEIIGANRDRVLSLEKDNQGFFAYLLNQENIKSFLKVHQDLILRMEWLVPHSLKTYRENAWRKVYVYDVEKENGEYLSYDEYKPLLDEYNIEYIPPIRIIKNGTKESFYKLLENNNYLIKDGEGAGEGCVLKRYDYKNKYGQTIWAKIVTSEFKEKHIKEMGAPENELISIETKIIDDFATKAFIEKEFYKIKNENWSPKKIPQLLSTIYHVLITEEMWNILKKYRNPTIDFKRLNGLVIQKIKQTLPEAF